MPIKVGSKAPDFTLKSKNATTQIAYKDTNVAVENEQYVSGQNEGDCYHYPRYAKCHFVAAVAFVHRIG